MRIVMMGTGSFAEPIFESVLGTAHSVVGLVTQPDRVTGKERGSTRLSQLGMKEIALQRNLPVYQPESINTPEGIERLQSWQAELLVVAAYGQILSRDVLAATPFGGINVHASLLPKYRGAAPIAWVIYNGETETGVTIIRMSPFLDAGEMLVQESLPIDPEETAGELEARLAPLGARLAVRAVKQIAAGTAKGITQDKTQATKAPKLTKEHGVIDWTRSAEQVRNQIRAMQPWPTPYTFLHQEGETPERLIIYRTALPGPGSPALSAGEAASVDSKRLFVGTADGALEILELQPAGKRRMAPADYLRGHPLRAGARFGSEHA